MSMKLGPRVSRRTSCEWCSAGGREESVVLAGQPANAPTLAQMYDDPEEEKDSGPPLGLYGRHGGDTETPSAWAAPSWAFGGRGAA